MDHYLTLGISRSATDYEIKKAYRQMALKYHPDRNQGDPAATDEFKKVAAAYEVLSDPKKKAEYDGQNKGSGQSWGYTFTDDFTTFANNFRNSDFRRQNNERARKSQGKTHADPIDTSYLDITVKCEVELKEVSVGKKVDISFSRKKIVYNGAVGQHIRYTKEDEEKEIKVNFDLRKTYLAIKKEGNLYSSKVKVNKFGNEDVTTRTNIWGEIEQYPLCGDLYIIVEFAVPADFEIENSSIVQKIEIPLYKAILPDEKIEITTLFDKKYEATIKNPKDLNNLKFVIPEQGIIDQSGEIGQYIVKFVVLAPKVSELSKSKIENLRTILVDL